MPPPKKARDWSKLYWLLLLPLPVLWCVFNHYGLLTFAENRTIDWRFQYRGELKAPAKVIYADVDSLSIAAIGNFPWSRIHYSRVASALVNVAKVRAVGFDFVFSDYELAESADLKRIIAGNAEFSTFLRKDPPVALAAGYAGHEYIDVNGHRRERVLPVVSEGPLPAGAMDTPEVPTFLYETRGDKPLYWNPATVGLIDTQENGTRTVPAYAPTSVRTYFHMALELARLNWGLPPGSIKVAGDHIDFVRPTGEIVRRVPLRNRQLVDVNWFVHWNSPQTFHVEFADLFKYADALNDPDPDLRKIATEYFQSDDFKDAIVLVGPVDPLLQDLAPTSLDDKPVPKVGVHGNLLMTILSGRFLHSVPETVANGITIALAVIMAFLAIAGGARATIAKILALAIGAVYVAIVFQAFDRWDLTLPLVAPVGAAFTTSFVGLIWQVVVEQKAKGRIKGMFGTYLSPTVVERMIESGKDPELGGHDSEITAYFSDIQSFSSFSEVLPSSRLGELLNEYLTACTDIVQAETGTLDKYIGDAVVAMFGAPVDAPDHAYRACLASQLAQRRIGELREKWRSEGDKWPVLVHGLRTRIGLNTGVCMIGNMGSRTRFNYTMMGDNVNLAARMESGAKSWGVYTMCTESTKQACLQRDPNRFLFRALGRIVVKGRSQPVPIHEIVGLSESLTDQTRECVAIFEAGLQKVYSRDWDGAMAQFRRSEELEPSRPGREPGVSSNPSLVYTTKIIDELRSESLPSDWDGRYVMHEK